MSLTEAVWEKIIDAMEKPDEPHWMCAYEDCGATQPAMSGDEEEGPERMGSCHGDAEPTGALKDLTVRRAHKWVRHPSTSPLPVRLQDLPLAALIAEHDRLQDKIDANDGRQSTGSSAQLDYDMDCREEVSDEILRRLGAAKDRPWLDDLLYRVEVIERRLRLGHARSGRFELLGGYLNIAPLHVWIDEIRFGLVGPLRRGERPHWVRFSPGAWIFGNERVSRGAPGFGSGGRWGFGVLGVEIGSRDPADPVGCWLKDCGLWPW